MSEDRINAMKEFVAFLKRKKGMDVSGDLYIDHVNFLFSEIAALRAELADAYSVADEQDSLWQETAKNLLERAEKAEAERACCLAAMFLEEQG